MTLPNVTLATGPGACQACTQVLYNANSRTIRAPPTSNVTLNARTAHIFGAEWDVAIKPIEALTLNFNGSYLDATLHRFHLRCRRSGYLLPIGGTNLSGTPFPLPASGESKRDGDLRAVDLRDIFWHMPVDDILLSTHYYWQIAAHLANMTGFDPSQRTGSCGLLNLRAEIVNIGGTHADMAFFVDNVLDTPVCLPEYNGTLNSAPNASYGIANTAGVLQCVPLTPRMVGVQLTIRF